MMFLPLFFYSSCFVSDWACCRVSVAVLSLMDASLSVEDTKFSVFVLANFAVNVILFYKCP